MHPMLTVLLQNATDTATQAAGTAPAAGSTAPATQAPAPGFDLGVLGLPIILMAIFYFIAIRPQRKEQKRRIEMLSKIKKGDRVLTHAGIIGTVAGLKDEEVTIEVDNNVRIRFSRGAIAQVLTSTEEKEMATAGK